MLSDSQSLTKKGRLRKRKSSKRSGSLLNKEVSKSEAILQNSTEEVHSKLQALYAEEDETTTRIDPHDLVLGAEYVNKKTGAVYTIHRLGIDWETKDPLVVFKLSIAEGNTWVMRMEKFCIRFRRRRF